MSPPTPGSSILMISAPRSASTWVPNGPAPNCETARMRTPSRGGLFLSCRGWSLMSIGQLARAKSGMVLLRHEHLARVRAHLLAALVQPRGLHGHHAPIALAGLVKVEDAALGIEGVADEGGLLVLERIHFQIGDGAPRDVGHAHADDHAEDERAHDHALLVLRVRLGIMGIGMQGMLVHGQQREPRAVGLGEGAPRPVLELLPDREVLEVAPVAHADRPASRAASWRRSRSMSALAVTKREASR